MVHAPHFHTDIVNGYKTGSTALAKVTHKQEIYKTIPLGNELVEYATLKASLETINTLHDICNENVVYNTSLNQWQLTKALVLVIKQQYIKLYALITNNERIPQMMIDIAHVCINEYNTQHITYTNIKHIHDGYHYMWPNDEEHDDEEHDNNDEMQNNIKQFTPYHHSKAA